MYKADAECSIYHMFHQLEFVIRLVYIALCEAMGLP